jgi:hypothetical protein
MRVFEGTFSFIPPPIEISLYLVPQPTELIGSKSQPPTELAWHFISLHRPKIYRIQGM